MRCVSRWLSLCLALSLSPALAQDDSKETFEESTPVAVEVAPPLPRPELPNRSQAALQLFQQQLGEELIEIPSTNATLAALYLPANSPEPKGIVVLIPGAHEHANTQRYIGSLRHALADKGWHSLSLNLPDPSFQPLYIKGKALTTAPQTEAPIDTADTAEDTEAASALNPNTETESEQTARPPVTTESEAFAPPYNVLISELLSDALAHAQTISPQPVILLAQHEGAYWALEQALHNQPAANALILLDPRLPEEATHSFAQLIEPLSVTSVELYSPLLNKRESEATHRRKAAKRNPTQSYQHIRVNEQNSALAQQAMQTKVLGWLHRYHSE